MNDENSEARLTKSYSVHADFILQDIEHHRRRHEPPKCTQSGPDFRHVDLPAIRNQKNEVDESNEGQRTWRISGSTSKDEVHPSLKNFKIGCGDFNLLKDQFSEISLAEQSSSMQDLAIYEREASFSTSENMKTLSSVERSSQMYNEYDENFDTVSDTTSYHLYQEQRLAQGEGKNGLGLECAGSSVSSCSLNSMANCQRLNGVPLLRQISYEDWTHKKQRELQRRRNEERRAQLKRREIEERERREKEEKEKRDYECFLEWTERKKREKMIERKLMEKEEELKKRIQDFEDKTKSAGSICIKQWRRKKTELQKAMEKEESMKKKKAEEEKQRRLEESFKAYEKWRERAKKIPKPATQGLLPHQKAKPAFTNPMPWQPLVNNGSDESDEGNQQVKSTNAAVKNQRSKRTHVKR